MEEKKYRLFLVACLILFMPTLLLLPVSIFQLAIFVKWKNNQTDANKIQLEKILFAGLTGGFGILCVASVLFYHYGPNFIEVMGTFY